MSARRSQMRKGALTRKLKEQTLAKSRGLHQRWQHTKDATGAGRKTRLVCSKAPGGEIHLMSQAELAEFLEGWYRADVRVIHDQVALDRTQTQKSAASLNVAHPRYRRIDEPAVISTSLLYITERKGCYGKEARSVRSVREGRDRDEAELTRVQLIERRAWERDGAVYVAVGKDGMRAQRSRNLAWLFRAYNDTVGRSLSDGEMKAQRGLLRLVRSKKDMTVLEACGLVERTFGLPPGSGVQAFRQLAGARRLAFDLDVSNPVTIPVAEIWRPGPSTP
ncbi:heteromeric transposase endonuclease subunit TnsA [bacterium M00.F.Ca.ET.228.01.1.1]|nr:heteromeric transposase endonuclease subunit TnsA [bacterium M00.F.Ca.ET.228.01.1.1]TGR95600.1 heteromeric transposase endonuclease subunit TnsA [bacterium M00.F.Ca.ET.191.01.1.1]TGT96588.1 heteromeric transposase endonuclease subunit TnsA [bacterium M00.F.Ca.ET.155.01.1.1]